MANRIDALARRVEDDHFFLGAALADYARSEHLDENSLAATLGCATEILAPLRLCRRPHVEPNRFQLDVTVIANRFGVNADVLAEIVRRADALSRLRQAATKGLGLLMAARDREDDPRDPDTGGDS